MKAKKKSGYKDDKLTKTIILATAILNLINAIIALVSRLLNSS